MMFRSRWASYLYILFPPSLLCCSFRLKPPPAKRRAHVDRRRLFRSPPPRVGRYRGRRRAEEMSKTKDHERHIVRPNGPHILFSYCLMDLMDGATECLSSWIIFFFFLAGLVVVTSQDEADSAFLTHTPPTLASHANCVRVSAHKRERRMISHLNE